MTEFPVELAHGSGVTLVLDASRLLIEFTESPRRKELERLLGQVDLMVEPDEGDDARRGLPAEIINHTDLRWWVRARSGRTIDDDTHSALREKLGDKVAWIGPVYEVPNTPGRGGRVCPLPQVLVVQPVGRVAEGEDPLEVLARRLKLEYDAERSRYLAGWRVFAISDVEDRTAYELRDIILRSFREQVRDVRFETMPMVRDLTATPNDPLYPQQWGMTQIDAGGPGSTGWDLSTGSNAIIIAVIDYGFDLGHPDLTYVGGVNLSTMTALTAADSGTDPHGTACCGIIAAGFNNAEGVAGLAGACRLMPVRRVSGSDVETANGINWAAVNGAHVISMSFGRYAPGEGQSPTGWDFTLIDPEIANAVNLSGCVLCAATGNEDIGTVNRYPARHPLVIACGASDQVDNRKSMTSPDGETWWGSNFGTDVYLGVTTGVSVVAPGVLIPTTDHQGNLGYNTTAGAAGNYFMTFNGTSSATPHVAGLAALLRSLYPALNNVQVRSIIERTVEKVGAVAYAEDVAFPSGTRNQQMGYGRINVRQSLDLADVLIRDWPGDTGVEPSTPPGGNFWDFADIVVRIFDDDVFVPDDLTQSKFLELGQTNYLYVRIRNNGPRDARNVAVSARITPFVGTQFVYPTDWAAVDATHISPTPVTASFVSIPAGGEEIAKFTISAAQVDVLFSNSWHPCLVASVAADNDFAFASAAFTASPIVTRRNNLAQRNLSVINVLSDAAAAFPFLAGHVANAQQLMEIVVNRSALPKAMPLLLALDEDNEYFPEVDLDVDPGHRDDCHGSLVFLERTRVLTEFGCCHGALTLAKGSRFDCASKARVGSVNVTGGDVIVRGAKRYVQVRDDVALIRMEKAPNQVVPLLLQTQIPGGASLGTQFRISVAQRDDNHQMVGGASVVFLAG